MGTKVGPAGRRPAPESKGPEQTPAQDAPKPNLAVLLNYPLQNQIDVGHYDVLKTQFESSRESFGHVFVISPRDGRHYASMPGITIRSNGWSHPGLYYGALLKDIATLVRLVRKHHVRVIRAMAPTSGFAAIIAARLTGAKTVVSVHTDEDLAREDEGRRALRNAFVDRVVPFVMRHADCIPVISGHIRDYALRKGADPRKIVLHPNFVDTDRFRPGLAHKVPNQVLFVGRLSKVKGADDGIEVMARLIKKHPDAVLKIAGRGEQEQALRQRVHALGLDAHVHFLGRVDHETQLPRLMSESAAFLAPQMAGFTLIESMASGLPIVAGDVEWSKEILQDGTGILVPAGSIQGLADAMDGLLSNPSRRVALGLTARKYAEDNFSLKAWKAREASFYRRLIDARME